jgi:formylglycine-generating enzyme required for sulfatase activity
MQESFCNKNEVGGAVYNLIPGGKYIYSASGETISVPNMYFAKYAVTNERYRSFIAFLRKKDAESDAFLKILQTIAQAGQWGEGFGAYLKKGEHDLAELFCSHYWWMRKFDRDEQPAVGVTWYGAQAYACWLSFLENNDKRKAGTLAKYYRLPTEQEWEWAAGGKRGEAVQKVRTYPWPEEKGLPTSKLAIYDSAFTGFVHWCPDGITPEELYNMAGNVWEWMRNPFDPKTPNSYALRGGCWNNSDKIMTCSARIFGHPEIVDFEVGFRVVCNG